MVKDKIEEAKSKRDEIIARIQEQARKQEEEKKREEQNEKMDTQCVICMCEMVGLELNRAAASSKDRFKIHDGYQD